MQKTLKVGLVQQQAWPDKARSLEASEAGIRELAERGAELVLLQELHATHYFCQSEDAELFERGLRGGGAADLMQPEAKELFLLKAMHHADTMIGIDHAHEHAVELGAHRFTAHLDGDAAGAEQPGDDVRIEQVGDPKQPHANSW